MTPLPHATALLRLFSTSIVFFALAAHSMSQQVFWKIPPGGFSVGEIESLMLVYDQCEPDGNPALPQVADLDFGTPSVSQQTSVINFQISQTVTYSYPVQFSKAGKIQIPSFEARTSKGTFLVAPLDLNVKNSSQSFHSGEHSTAVFSRLHAEPTTVWEGQVFDLDYTILVLDKYSASLSSDVKWDASPLFIEEWSKPDKVTSQSGGERRNGAQYRTRACSPKRGQIKFPPAEQRVNVETGVRQFGLFTQPKVEQLNVKSEPLTLEVRPLPAPPTGFSKAVGKFNITSQAVPAETTVGDPVTWTVSLSGIGNWPTGIGLPEREISTDFKVIQPKSKKDFKEGILFDGTLTEDVVIIPSKSGDYTLPSIRYVYFDPELGKYQTQTTQPIRITVKPKQGSVSAQSPSAATSSKSPAFHVQPKDSPPSVDIPKIPRDPIAQPENLFFARAPLGPVMRWICLLPLLGVPIFWLVLSLQRSSVTDPLAPRRRAQKRAFELAGQIRNANGQHPLASHLLLEWRHETALLLGMKERVPTPDEVAFASVALSKITSEEWSKQWRETDAFLFAAPPRALPEDWPDRAAEITASVRLPRQHFLAPLFPRNLFPAIFCVLFFVGQPDSSAQLKQAETPLEAYQAGRFASAEESWQKRVSEHPTDWAARNNLALSSAQQNRWDEAAAHMLSARLISARNPSVVWNFNLAAARASFRCTEIDGLRLPQDGLPNPPLFQMFVSHVSPVEWELALAISVLAVAVGASLFLLTRYREKPPIYRRTGTALQIFGGLIFLLSFLALRSYGTLAHPDAAIVWKKGVLRSIPTDADTQQTKVLSSGSVVQVEKRFLGWLKIRMSNNETGWVRQHGIVPLYQTPKLMPSETSGL